MERSTGSPDYLIIIAIIIILIVIVIIIIIIIINLSTCRSTQWNLQTRCKVCWQSPNLPQGQGWAERVLHLLILRQVPVQHLSKIQSDRLTEILNTIGCSWHRLAHFCMARTKFMPCMERTTMAFTITIMVTIIITRKPCASPAALFTRHVQSLWAQANSGEMKITHDGYV